MEVRFESGLDCFKKVADPGELEAIGSDEAVKGVEMATGSLFDCINAAMGTGSFTLPRNDG